MFRAFVEERRRATSEPAFSTASMAESFRTRLMRWRFNWFPAYRDSGARIEYIDARLREVRLRLPLNRRHAQPQRHDLRRQHLRGGRPDPRGDAREPARAGGIRRLDQGGDIRFRRQARTDLTARFVLTRGGGRRSRGSGARGQGGTAVSGRSCRCARAASARRATSSSISIPRHRPAGPRACGAARDVHSHMSPEFSGRTILVTGASRGIGRAIAVRLGRGGANVVVAAKSDEPHPKLPGTIHEVAAEVEAAGGQRAGGPAGRARRGGRGSGGGGGGGAFRRAGRAGQQRGRALADERGEHDAKRYDLIQGVNARAVFLCARGRPAAPETLRARAHPEPVSAAEFSGRLAARLRAVHPEQVRHDDPLAGHGGGVSRARASR